jgi:chromosome segregation ATPase
MEAQLWVGLIGGAVGLLTAIVGVWRRAVAARGKRAQVAEKNTANQVQTALSALLEDADKSRDYVMARLNSQETRLASLQAQLDGARDSLRELRAENMSLQAQLAATEQSASTERAARRQSDVRTAELAAKLDEANKRAEASARELHEYMDKDKANWKKRP